MNNDERYRAFFQPLLDGIRSRGWTDAARAQPQPARYREVDSEITHNTRHVAQPLRLPVLAVGGERVFGSAVADNLRNGAATNVRSEVLAGCGHYLSEERSDDVARLLTEFFQPNENHTLA